MYLNLLMKTISFDLILVDPPYGQKELNLLIESCLNMLNPNGSLVLETSTKG